MDRGNLTTEPVSLMFFFQPGGGGEGLSPLKEKIVVADDERMVL